MGTVDAYVREVRQYCKVVCGVKVALPPGHKKLVARAEQAPKATTKVVKQPCPKHLVAAVIQDTTVDLAIRLGAVLMWFATLRMGEVTNPLVAEFDPSFALLRRDVVVAANGSMASFRFRKGKPDKTNKGSQRFILQAPRGAAFCPVQFVKQFLDATQHLSPDEPLLVTMGKDGQRRCVTRDHVDAVIQRHALRLGYAPGSLTLHSFRSGSATALVDSGIVTPMDMQIQGGWTSAQGPVPYLRHNVGTYQRASDALAIYVDDWRAGVDPSLAFGGRERVGFGHQLSAVPRILAPTLARRRGSVAPCPVSARGGHGGVGAGVGLQSSVAPRRSGPRRG